jgi:hypothetical protein
MIEPVQDDISSRLDVLSILQCDSTGRQIVWALEFKSLMMGKGDVSVQLHAMYVHMSACTTFSMGSVSNVVIMSRVSRPDISTSALTTAVEY